MLRCPMAAKAPSAIEAMADEDHDLLPLRRDARERPTMVVRTNMAMPATFGAAAKNAVIGVGAPS